MKKSPEQKAAEKLAKLLGMDAPKTIPAQVAHERSMEAEAALEYYENPRSFKEKNCKQCGLSFATRGAPVAYCSDPCRVRAFEERMGVKWLPNRRAEDRWGFMGEPLTVPHEALIVVQAVMAEQASAQEEANQAQRDYFDTMPEIAPDSEVNVLDLLSELGLD